MSKRQILREQWVTAYRNWRIASKADSEGTSDIGDFCHPKFIEPLCRAQKIDRYNRRPAGHILAVHKRRVAMQRSGLQTEVVRSWGYIDVRVVYRQLFFGG